MDVSGPRKIWLVALAYWLVMSVVVCLLYPCCASDSMARYAPMADAFARGEWQYAFHPRFGVFFQCLSGSVAWMTGLSGDHACQTAALLCLALAAVPIWSVASRLFDERIAWWSVVALLVCNDFVCYCFDGMRDVGKCLAFALLAAGVVGEKPKTFAIGLFVLTTLVAYGFAVACALLFGWCVWMLVRRRYGALILPVMSWCAGVAAVTFMVHAYTGWWVPAPHFIKLAEALA